MEKIKIKFTDFYKGNPKPSLYKFLSKHFDFEYSDNPDFLFYSCWGYDHLNYDCCRIYTTIESLRPNYWECDYAFGFDYSQDHRYYRLPNFRYCDDLFKELTVEKSVEELFGRKDKFCSFIFSNGSPKTRKRFFKELSEYQTVDAAGPLLNNMGKQLPRGFTQEGIPQIVPFMRSYKFAIVFENSSYPGYTTEKLYHAMLANTVPIYWGNPYVAKDFNPKSFINCHDFDNFEAVIKHIKELDQNDDLYKLYLAEPYFKNNEIPDHLKEDRIVERFRYIFQNKNLKPVAQSWKKYFGLMKRVSVRPIGPVFPYSPFLPFPIYRYSKMKQWIGEYRYDQYKKAIPTY